MIRLRSDRVKALRDPKHFRHWIWYLHRGVPIPGVAESGDRRVYIAAPPQHGKTLTTLWGLAWLCLDPRPWSHAYMTYSAQRAGRMNRLFRLILNACGIAYEGDLSELRLENGTTIQFVSAQQGLTGSPITGVLLVDDLYKEQKDADSPAYRETIELMWPNSVLGRLHEGASVLVLGTRWHPQDYYGKLVEEQRYREIKLPAFAEEGDVNGREIGEVLAPEIHSSDYLLDKKRDMLPSAWDALYQCNPRVRGAGMFQEPSFYSALPVAGYRGAYGIDLAYTDSSLSDESVCLEMWREETTDSARPRFYVVNLWHGRERIEVTGTVLQGLHGQRPAWPMLWRCSGTERGSAMLLKAPPWSLPINVRTISGDKRVSNADVAVAWNDGRVLLPDMSVYPQHAAWCKALIKQCLDFRGDGKEHDDIVDGLGNAHFELKSVRGIQPQTARSMRA